MKARRVNESLKDILVPKTKQEIKKGVKESNNPSLLLKFKIREACQEYWKKKGVKFGQPNSVEIFYDERGEFSYEFGFSSSKLLNRTPFIAEYSDIIGTQMGAFNQLYGRFMLKGGKWSNTTQSIIYMKINE